MPLLRPRPPLRDAVGENPVMLISAFRQQHGEGLKLHGHGPRGRRAPSSVYSLPGSNLAGRTDENVAANYDRWGSGIGGGNTFQVPT